MQIIQITVEAHEKRNHPHEYGHADASCRVVADIHPQDDVGVAVAMLQGRARRHVSQELDAWIAGIEEGLRIERVIHRIESALRNLDATITSPVLRYAKPALRAIRELPLEMQPGWEERFRESLRKAAVRRYKALEEEERAGKDDSPLEDTYRCSTCGETISPEGWCCCCDEDREDDDGEF